jgi:HAD superfamily hydrolase (TIGR01509 family)
MDAVIFDFDGLILDTEWPAYLTAAEAYMAHGLELTVDEWVERIGRGDNRPWTDRLAAHLPDLDLDEVDSLRRLRKNVLTDAEPLLPGVVELLDVAAHIGIAVAVASSSPIEWVGRHLDHYGLTERFGAIRTRDHVERAKPWPDVFLAAAEALEVEPARAIVFEDSVNGVIAAKAAGMFCVAVPNRLTLGGDFSEADLVVESLLDIDLHGLLVP